MNEEQFNIIMKELKEIKNSISKPKTKKICPICKKHSLYIDAVIPPKDVNDLPKIHLKCLNNCGFIPKTTVDLGIYE